MFPQVRETLDLRFLITADHCLRRIPDDAELVLDFGPEGELRGRIHERLADADLALIWLLSKPQLSRPMLADHAHREDRWRVPSRPTASDPHLNGVINGNSQFKTDGGAVIEALEQDRRNVIFTRIVGQVPVPRRAPETLHGRAAPFGARPSWCPRE
jgi:hypothetical protein